MTTDLVQKLRTCSKEERKDIAMKLAQTGTDEAIKELIKIVNGGEHTYAEYGRKHWYSISTSCLQPERWEYDLPAQLDAIEALGETRSKIALDFLRKIHTLTEKELSESPGNRLIYRGEKLISIRHTEMRTCEEPLTRSECFHFENAKGPLCDALYHHIVLTMWDGSLYEFKEQYDKSEEQIEEFHRKKLESEPHKTIILAIQKLESIVQNNSPQYNPLTIFTFTYEAIYEAVKEYLRGNP